MIYPEKLYNLSQEDEPFLQKLITDGIAESLTLEYKKELPSNNIELAKDVSSFANSNGGIIIYGIEEDNTTHKPTNLNPLDSGLEEKIENIILTSISPKLSVKIVAIKSTIEADKKYYTVYILSSSDAPYMVISGNNYRYYKRVNFSSVPMNDNEVKNLCILNLKIKEESIKEIREKKNLFIKDENEGLFLEYLKFSFKINSQITLDLKNLDFSKIGRSIGSHFGGTLLVQGPKHYGKGLLFEYGLFENFSNDFRSYLIINENNYIEYVRLGIIIVAANSQGVRYRDLNDVIIIDDFIRFIYFLKELCTIFNILSEILIYIEIKNIKDTILNLNRSFPLRLYQKSLYESWEDYKYYPSTELIDKSNEIIKYFADRIFQIYGHQYCTKIIPKDSKLTYLNN